MSWSRHGYENASYCISHTGRQPAMHSPTAEPRIPASASGVSTQRSGPKRSRRPAVARKTRPARPTSSPMTMTFASRSISTCSASFTASTRNRSAKDAPELLEIGAERRGRIGVGMLEQQCRIGGRLGLGGRDALAHARERLLLDLRRERVREHTQPAEVALVTTDAFVALLLLDALEVDVDRRVVGGRVRRGAVGQRLDEGRPLARPSPRHRLAR